MDHTDEDPDPRYEFRDLNVDWQFRSPLARTETVTRVTRGDGVYSTTVQVWTDQTGPSYAWNRPGWEKVYAIPAPPEQFPTTPEIRILDVTGKWGARSWIKAVLTFAHVEIPGALGDNTLAQATHLGQGQGWELVDRPAGGDTVTTHHADKAHARTALMRAARAHAKALHIPVCTEDDPHSHNTATARREGKPR